MASQSFLHIGFLSQLAYFQKGFSHFQIKKWVQCVDILKDKIKLRTQMLLYFQTDVGDSFFTIIYLCLQVYWPTCRNARMSPLGSRHRFMHSETDPCLCYWLTIFLSIILFYDVLGIMIGPKIHSNLQDNTAKRKFSPFIVIWDFVKIASIPSSYMKTCYSQSNNLNHSFKACSKFCIQLKPKKAPSLILLFGAQDSVAQNHC